MSINITFVAGCLLFLSVPAAQAQNAGPFAIPSPNGLMCLRNDMPNARGGPTIGFVFSDNTDRSLLAYYDTTGTLQSLAEMARRPGQASDTVLDINNFYVGPDKDVATHAVMRNKKLDQERGVEMLSPEDGKKGRALGDWLWSHRPADCESVPAETRMRADQLPKTDTSTITIIAVDTFKYTRGPAVIVLRPDAGPREVVVVDRKAVTPEVVYSAIRQVMTMRAIGSQTPSPIPLGTVIVVPNHPAGSKLDMHVAALAALGLQKGAVQDLPGIGQGPIVTVSPFSDLKIFAPPKP